MYFYIWEFKEKMRWRRDSLRANCWTCRKTIRIVKKKNPWCSNCTHFGLFRFLEEVETKFLVPVAAHSGVEKFCSTKEMGIIKEVWKSFQEKGDIELGNIILQGPKLTKGKESLPAFLLQIWWWESSRSLKTLMKISQAIVSKG